MSETLTLPVWPPNFMAAPRGAVTTILRHLISEFPAGGSVDIGLPEDMGDRLVVTNRANWMADRMWGSGACRVTVEDRVMTVARA